jgi:hypothetical protein
MKRREAFLHTPFDLLAIFIVILTQWHMSRQFLAAAGRSLSARAALVTRWALAVFYALMAAASRSLRAAWCAASTSRLIPRK